MGSGNSLDLRVRAAEMAARVDTGFAMRAGRGVKEIEEVISSVHSYPCAPFVGWDALHAVATSLLVQSVAARPRDLEGEAAAPGNLPVLSAESLGKLAVHGHELFGKVLGVLTALAGADFENDGGHVVRSSEYNGVMPTRQLPTKGVEALVRDRRG